MAIQETLKADLKAAMLGRDAETVSVLRMLQASLKNESIGAMRELSEEESLGIIRKEAKKRDEAALTYRSLNQEERAGAEEREAVILRKYLPAAADPAEVRTFVEGEAKRLAPLEPKHRGELIRSAMARFSGRIDGKVAADIVGSLF